MKRIILVLSAALISSNLSAQESRKLDLSLSYFGYNLAYPGIKVGAQFGLKTWDKTKTKKKGEVTKYRQAFFSPQLGFYNHKKNHAGVLLNTEFGIEMNKGRRFYQSHSIGLGYLTHLLAGSTYSLSSDGVLSEKKNDKIGYLMTSYNYELGQHVTKKFTWFCKISLASKLFYNLGMSYNTFQEVGIKYKLY
jgi:hypothetical protein